MSRKIIVPIKSNAMLKFPLHKPVLLFMSSGKIYSCRIIYAGKDFIKVDNVQERIIKEEREVRYIDLQLSEPTIFRRTKIEGYNSNDCDIKNQSKSNIKLIDIKTKKLRGK